MDTPKPAQEQAPRHRRDMPERPSAKADGEQTPAGPGSDCSAAEQFVSNSCSRSRTADHEVAPFEFCCNVAQAS